MGCCLSKEEEKGEVKGNGVRGTPEDLRYDEPPPEYAQRTPTKHIVPPEDQDNSIGPLNTPSVPQWASEQASDTGERVANGGGSSAVEVESVQLREKPASDVNPSVDIHSDAGGDDGRAEGIKRGTVTIATTTSSKDALVHPTVPDTPSDSGVTLKATDADVSEMASGSRPQDVEEEGVEEIELDGGQTFDIKVNDVKESLDVSPVTNDALVSAQKQAPAVSDIPTRNPMEESRKGKDSPNIRYQNRESMEYELPKDLPKPGPPSVRKKDLIKPNQFVVVDKIVDESPDDGFQSVPKLAKYLSGEVKKSEMDTVTDIDDDSGINLPPPVPTKRRKVDLFADPSVFKHIDDHARSAPENERYSVQKLATYLCSVAKSDLEKVRAFYFWICNNIGYLYDKDNPVPDRLKYDAASTLRQGQGSYVTVFVALCREVNIPALTILGCSKGLRHQPDRHFVVAERNHSWNAVYLDSEWRFIDCTWGSGFIQQDGKFQRKFDEYWFLTDPEVFIYDHFPTHPIWQLLEEPVDIDEFNTKPSMTEKSREVGFKLLSHREPIVYFDDEVTIQFATENIPLSNMTADFRTKDGNEVNQHRCIRRLDAQTFEVRVVPPSKGEYCLLIYGKSKDYLHAKFRKLMEYTLRCNSVNITPVVFPDHLKAWGPEPNYAKLGFDTSIETMSTFKCDSSEMTISLMQTRNTPITAELKAVEDQATVLEDYTMLTAEAGLKKNIHLRFPDTGYYKLEIYAEGDLGKYEYAAGFLIECANTMTTVKPEMFPKYNPDTICKHECALLEPLGRELPANTTVTFRLKTVGLKNVVLGIPLKADYGSRLKALGDLTKGSSGEEFSGSVKTPDKGESILLSGSAAPPNVFWTRAYEFVCV